MKKTLSKSEIKRINAELAERFGTEPFNKKELVELHEKQYVVRDGKVEYFYLDKKLYPTIRVLLSGKLLPSVVVDMGAVRFVTKGADVMRPGITEIPEGLVVGDAVVIEDETHHKPLAVGLMQHESAEMQEMEKGKVIRIIHYVGDDIWNYSA